MEEKENVSYTAHIQEFVKKNILFVGCLGLGFALCIIGLFQYFISKSGQNDVQFVTSSNEPAIAGVKGVSDVSKEISVDVEGGVQKPGVYSLKEGLRVQDALIASGGLSSKADREYVAQHFNLAQKLTDGAKIYIPKKGEVVASAAQNYNSNDVSGFAASDNTRLININSATLDQLDTLPKVGPVTAQKIISGRPYASKDELVSKKILTQKTFEGLKDKIMAE